MAYRDQLEALLKAYGEGALLFAAFSNLPEGEKNLA